MKKKRNNIIFLLLILITILLIGSFFVLKKDKKTQLEINTDENKNQNENDETNSLDEKNNIETTEPNNELFGMPSTSSSDTEGSSSDSPSSLECLLKQINYAMINPNKISTCNSQQGEICIDKTIGCSIEVENRDDKITGLFEIQILFIEEGKTKEDAIEFMNSEILLSPNSKQIITGSTNIQSSGEDGPANNQINCFYNTLKVPQKEIC